MPVYSSLHKRAECLCLPVELPVCFFLAQFSARSGRTCVHQTTLGFNQVGTCLPTISHPTVAPVELLHNLSDGNEHPAASIEVQAASADQECNSSRQQPLYWISLLAPYLDPVVMPPLADQWLPVW
ncbi:hypothetical protein DSO57_1033275 [Entomophthora muscae]|uniref:Uncharacterized protein n=1 Tax=Entomophthora muscae TaxID=34485 RepID=A0ACC2TBM0_9FUNG|nr:hypothetical protein DSO57_1033275 [Entomophthora muscae]